MGSGKQYKESSNVTSSPGSDTDSFIGANWNTPVELTTVKGYKDFMKQHPNDDRSFATVLTEDFSRGYIIKDDEVIANVYGEAKDYLIEKARH
ncbi:hypothetical protein KAFR_0G01570 [Kazachstania africana CBS 2517]|uniref:Uncharacterized protein n=1 Tax=Kazachstania africana (strain ATCC 22294 / BCRC 22015 / CBS 2517 / CECT 1963 / NBRC 1671 / NRRL Y-8276) TaxID=1071382 RepID=H2AXU1_KAZAF|nr:hypothetical protein KAFR_0G01570 [Kazachstania africana CBS 2517]CCF59191.1 hypothetical protein KAFR_0G01570 [Kazachstania africana CBS 2517]